jgi:drug/metabolite transporter (DMT)-like permease
MICVLPGCSSELPRPWVSPPSSARRPSRSSIHWSCLALITASLPVLPWAAEPLLILVLAVLLLRERISPPLVAVMTAVSAGALLVVQQGGSAVAGSGVGLTLAGVGCCALYTVLCRRALVDDATLPVVLVQQAAAFCLAVAIAGAAALLGRLDLPRDATPAAWLSAIGSGVLYQTIAFWFYLNGLRRSPPRSPERSST